MSTENDSNRTIFQKVEHIGIAVASIDEADEVYRKMLGVERYKVEDVASERVRTAFYQVGDTKIELLEPTHPESAISKFIEKRGPGLHHIAFEVVDIHFSMQRLRTEGFMLTRDTPIKGADNKLVCFVHPKTTAGTLIELCQEIIPGQDRQSRT